MLSTVEITNQCRAFHNEVMIAIRTTHLDFKCPTKWDWSARRTKSWGGPNGISIAMNVYNNPTISEENPAFYSEYASIKNRTDIGEFWYDDLMLGYKAVICHEVAHALCAHIYFHRIAHGEEWRSHYAQLRTVFVNPYIKRSLTGDLDNIYADRRNEQANCYLANCKRKGMEKEWLGQSYTDWQGRSMEIIGMNIRARKYPIIVRDVNTGKIWKTPAEPIIARMRTNAD